MADLGAFSICDPSVDGYFFGNVETTIGLGAGVVALTLGAYGPVPTELPIEYPIPSHARAGGFLGTTYLCIAFGGSVSITRYDAVGGRIEGTYEAHSFEPLEGDGPCPPSVLGAFSARREGDW